eukprot:c30220_g1_i1 orf=3-278(-)
MKLRKQKRSKGPNNTATKAKPNHAGKHSRQFHKTETQQPKKDMAVMQEEENGPIRRKAASGQSQIKRTNRKQSEEQPSGDEMQTNTRAQRPE